MLLNLAESTLFEREAVTLNLFSKQLPRPLDFTFHIWTLVDESNISLPSYFLSICVENRCRDTRVKSWVGYPASLAKCILVRREPINTKGIHKEGSEVVAHISIALNNTLNRERIFTLSLAPSSNKHYLEWEFIWILCFHIDIITDLPQNATHILNYFTNNTTKQATAAPKQV